PREQLAASIPPSSHLPRMPSKKERCLRRRGSAFGPSNCKQALGRSCGEAIGRHAVQRLKGLSLGGTRAPWLPLMRRVNLASDTPKVPDNKSFNDIGRGLVM